VTHSRGDNVDTNFTRGATYKIWVGKKRPKFSTVLDNFRLGSRISPERIEISQIRKMFDQLHFTLLGEKKSGELRSTNQKLEALMLTHPTGLFRETIFRHLVGAGPSNLYTC